MKKNVFIPAMKKGQHAELETLRDAEHLAFHNLLDEKRLTLAESFSFDRLVNEALEELKAFSGSVDAIVAQWDFPTSVMVPLLCREYDLPSPTRESVLKCEHKYWSRLEQQKVIPEHVPDFCSIDPFAENPLEQLSLDYPFWLKPVKAYASQLGFRVENEAQFHEAIKITREGIHRFGDPFNEALAHAELPEEIKRANGNTCIAEAIISGVQGAPEGVMYRGEFSVHGVIDQPKEQEELYDRMEYPSSLPEKIQQQMIDASRRFFEHIGYDNGGFNVEFMWNEEQDRLWVVEVNPRISQSHSQIFVMVDGMTNHEVIIDIALGRRPKLLNREGRFAVAAKCFIPYGNEDRIITRVPSQEELDALAERFPGTQVYLEVEPGMRLSELPNQSLVSYHLGIIFLGAENHEQLRERYQRCLESLHFESDPVE
ncbi:ATP-grasp domain-containing protein [Halomonas sp. ZH2S]|uniref:ATP-grasp domain-containing protein n=1 Tax=Vreelandella zhuhanensis TaxID=2684210 RepID=A0A7X3H098_9GAMM|nr:ATP-grasp domain-containing protein [Halomonas zhuhanensis]MWJ27994.1 ATP-grasp domain-containing protein [Halomonas zhuhanensis]